MDLGTLKRQRRFLQSVETERRPGYEDQHDEDTGYPENKEQITDGGRRSFIYGKNQIVHPVLGEDGVRIKCLGSGRCFYSWNEVLIFDPKEQRG